MPFPRYKFREFRLENDEDRYLIYDKRTYFGNFLEEQQLFERAVENFQKYVGRSIDIEFQDVIETVKDEFGNVQKDNRGEALTISNKKSIRFKVDGHTIKVSRGEERIFVWSVFLTLLEIIIEDLTESADTSEFSKINYIYIDDPISSLDDTNMGTSKNTSRASRASNLSLIYSLFLVNFCL